MKRKISIVIKIAFFLLILFLLASCENNLSDNNHVSQTNLDSVEIMTAGNVFEPYVRFKDGNIKKVSENYICLFINGSITDYDRVIFLDNIPMVSLNVVLDNLNISYKVVEKNKRLIINGEDDIEIFPDLKYIKINDSIKKLFTMTKLYNSEIYVGLNDINRIVGAKAVYYSNDIGDIDSSKNNYISNGECIIKDIPQIIISKYPSNAERISKDEAIKILQKKLKTAYEKKFGYYFSSSKKPSINTNEKEKFRYLFSHLSINSENDRFYVIPVVYDFWVDKYTGEVFVYYDGFPKTIKKFDPRDQCALDFAR